MDNRSNYPIYIVSKGRYKNPLTAKYFLKCGVYFQIAVEPQEYDDYCKAIGEKYVLKLNFSNLGLGSYPARNFCWEHAKSLGYERYWCFDDNIQGFAKWIEGKKKDIFNALDAIKYIETYAIKNNDCIWV